MVAKLKQHSMNPFIRVAFNATLWRPSLRDGFKHNCERRKFVARYITPFSWEEAASLIKATTKSFYDNCCWKEFDKYVEFARKNTTLVVDKPDRVIWLPC